MKKTIFFLFVFLTVICSYAQTSTVWTKKLTFKVGINTSNVSFRDFFFMNYPPKEQWGRPTDNQFSDERLILTEGKFNYYTIPLPSFGFTYQLLPLDSKFNILIGAGLQTKGFNNQGYPFHSLPINSKCSFNYIYLEVAAQYYIKRWLFLKTGLTQNHFLNSFDGNLLYMNYQKDLQKVEHAGLVGLGFEIPVWGGHKILLEGSYQHSLQNIINHPIRWVDTRFYYQVWNVSAGFRL